jgi:putative ABC transport system substrate-binding protein
MRRKTIILVFLVALAFAPSHLVEAQQLKQIFRIGFLLGSSGGESNLRGLRRGLRELGYVEGKNITIEYRSAEGKLDRLPALAAELVRLKVDVIVTNGTPAATAAKNATKTIPIIISGGTDPVATGLVQVSLDQGGISRA